MFEGRKHKIYNIRCVEKYFSKILAECGIDKAVSLEALRNTYIANQIECGMDKHCLIALTGLKNIKSVNDFTAIQEIDTKNIRIFTDGINLLKIDEDK